MTAAHPGPPAPPPGSVLLIDASAYLFRAWFGVPDAFFDSRGRSLNAVVGFAGALAGMVAQARPASLAVAFDEALFSGFRHRLDPGYKAGRALPDKALAYQLATARELVEELGMTAVASREYEADDLLATLAARARRAGRTCVMAGEDKDLAQAVGPDDFLWQVARGRVLDHAAVAAWLGVPPERLPERQALTGDPVDDIPGVPGVGDRTATALLCHCGHVQELLDDPARVATLPLRGAAGLAGRLAEHAPRVRLNLSLVTLATRAEGLPRLTALRYRAPSPDVVGRVARRIGLPAGTLRRLRVLAEDGE